MISENDGNTNIIRHFHISRKLRKKYNLADTLFKLNGEIVFTNFFQIHELTAKINESNPNPVYASDLNAVGIIHECSHLIIQKYKERIDINIFEEFIKIQKDKVDLDETLLKFIEDFPPNTVFNKETTNLEYLYGKSADNTNRGISTEEMLLLWLENKNPAFQPFSMLFDDTNLSSNSDYQIIINNLTEFLKKQPGFDEDGQDLITMLMLPMIAHPYSLLKQLEFIRNKWGYLLGDLMQFVLKALDFIDEEKKQRGFGMGEISVPDYFGYGEDEYERFSPDQDWMPKVVMIAKNAYVWMDQLSKQYQKNINTLDKIPDAELDKFAQYGFTGLWLIGLWERSNASKKIKQMCGNPEAEASAYSLKNYEVSYDMGGWDALHDLQRRCWQRGIRLAVDMVPNHTGIDSQWVIERPEWFLSLDHSPFPNYTFNGENLSNNERVGIYIEDHYYSQSDAAVVFKRIDFWTGDEKYIYHGNDGTTMPWNDTAQLNYINPEVRETVIQTILHVARNFPIIRFDAAMTLAKKHLQRLWFPEPGSGSDIPSRAEFGMTKSEFDKLIPIEFWREVVDRVAVELPDTLLLAEAFWMMESYFVRTLGMHRVYNSAFMNMLKMERNADYRTTIKKTMEFDPEVLKRFVNFLNNPDEETAVRQFGKGDKYFGVTLLMSTMPGLPMFGHGQIEGWEEKYGMEYRKAYWDEEVDQNFVERHKYDIFPLLHKRYLFSGVENFYLYDYFSSEGNVNENVFAYSNQLGDEHVLILYNNSFEATAGWIKTSVAVRNKETDELQQTKISDALQISNDENKYLIFKEHKANLEFIRRTSEVTNSGIFSVLNGYQYQIFWEMREVKDNEFGHYHILHDRLNGRGVVSIEDELLQFKKQEMDVLYISAEVTPFSKTGGLADVAGALPKEIAALNKKINVITPYYSIINNSDGSIQNHGVTGNIQLGAENYKYELHHLFKNDVNYYFIKNDQFFNRENIYTDENGIGYEDNFNRFLFLQYVVINLIERGLFETKLIHCNDHHAALIPWMLKNRNLSIPSVLTIHNAEYQGEFDLNESKLLIEIDYRNIDKRRKTFNSLELGIKCCSAVNTVSYNYARELLKSNKLSFGMSKILNRYKGKFSGIINGADYSVWDPYTDKYLEHHFSLESLTGKNKNKQNLLKKCKLEYSQAPVIGMVSRLVKTKGFDLLLNVLDKILEWDIKLIILGTGDSKIVEKLEKYSKAYPNKMNFLNYFDEQMAHLIEAGSDMFLMPSHYEPCGLNQIYSLRYGTLPIVFNTGGLADTVSDWNGKTGNGFKFYKYNSNELVSALENAVNTFEDKEVWGKLIKNAMSADYSWSMSAQEYLNLYVKILKENLS